MRKLLLLWSVSVLLSVGLHAQEAPDWEVYESPTYDYSIWYVEEFEEDVDLAEKAIDYAHEVGFEKYGVEDTHAHLRVKLYPAEGVFDLHKRIWAGTAWYSYYSRDPYAEIVFLTPSSPDKQGSITTLQLPYDDPATSAKTLVHESIHHIQTSVKQELGIRKWPWLPHWFSEGMAEYEGLRYMIDEFKPNALDLLIDSLDYSGGPNNSISSATYRRHRFACCWGLSDVPEIQIGDAYNSGNLFLWHLAEMFGEEIHDGPDALRCSIFLPCVS